MSFLYLSAGVLVEGGGFEVTGGDAAVVGYFVGGADDPYPFGFDVAGGVLYFFVYEEGVVFLESFFGA